MVLSASHRTRWNEDIHRSTRTRRRLLTVYFLPNESINSSKATHGNLLLGRMRENQWVTIVMIQRLTNDDYGPVEIVGGVGNVIERTTGSVC